MPEDMFEKPDCGHEDCNLLSSALRRMMKVLTEDEEMSGLLRRMHESRDPNVLVMNESLEPLLALGYLFESFLERLSNAITITETDISMN